MPCGRFGADAFLPRGAALARNRHGGEGDRAVAGEPRAAGRKRGEAAMLVHPARHARQRVPVLRRAAAGALQAALARGNAPG